MECCFGTFAGSVLESALEAADSSPESAHSISDFMRVCCLPVLNKSNVSTLIHLADSHWPTIAVGYSRWPTAIGPVSMGLEYLFHEKAIQANIVPKVTCKRTF